MTAFSRFRKAPSGAHAYDPYADEAITPEAATEALARMEPEVRPLGELVQAPPARREGPRPTFTPRSSGPPTRADFVIPRNLLDPLSRDYLLADFVRPVIGDSIPVPPPGNSIALGRGWSRYLAIARLTDPNRDARDARRAEALHAQHEQGLGRNAVELAGVARHFRERVVEAAERYCAGIGHPEMARALLDRVTQLNEQARLQDRGAA